LRRIFLWRKPEIRILESYVHNFYLGESLDEKQAKDRLNRCIVELVDRHHRHVGNGLLVTYHGFFVTSAHCLEGDIVALRLFNLHEYPILSVLKMDTDRDIALLKADIPWEESPVCYRYFREENFSPICKIAVVLLKGFVE
jgi:hypothetical protein